MLVEEDIKLNKLAELISEEAIEEINNNLEESCFYEIQRVLQFPEKGNLIIAALKDFVESLEKDTGKEFYFAGGGHGGSLLAFGLGNSMQRPSCTVFRKPKLGEKQIKGFFEEGKEYLLLEECWRSGGQTTEYIDILRREGGHANYAVSILDRSNNIAARLLEQFKVTAYSLLTEEDILNYKNSKL